MQQVPLLQTKLHIPPVRRELVSRPRLVDRLNAGLPTQGGFPRALSLISAPAGFGKTTLVSEWVHILRGMTPPISVAWLSLDEGDNDPARFLAYLIAALRNLEAGIGQGALSALQSPQPPPVEDVLIPLINDLVALSDSMVLVLDDHHVIESPPVNEGLAFLLKRLPPQIHLVIATREDPYLPLARFRVRDQLTELRAADLRFTAAEAAEFLNRTMGLDLPAREIAALETRTEGWIAGLQLAAISMKGRQDTSGFVKSFTGSHRYVLDYLMEEVLQQQPESVQTFLWQTAILDRLTGPLCDAVTGKDNGLATLELLERANLFVVPLDEERRWYRYHHLFGDLLRQSQGQAQAAQTPALHHRASAWYEQNGFIDDAIQHAVQAKEFERTAELIEKHVDALWQRGQHNKLRRWLADLPGKLVSSKPHLCILRAWDLFTSGQQDTAEQSLQAAERALDAVSDGPAGASPPEQAKLSDAERRMIRGRAAAIRAFLAFYRGDAQQTGEHARRALELLPEQDMTWRSTATVALGDAHGFAGDLAAAHRVRLEALELSKAAGNIYMVLIAAMKVAVTLRFQGKLERALELCRQHLQVANESGLSQTVVTGWLLAIWGEILAEQSDLDGALDKATTGTQLTANGRDLAAVGWSFLCLLRIQFSRGDMTGANETIQFMKEMAEASYVPPWITNQMAAWQARIWLAQGKLEAASDWAKSCGQEIDAAPPYLREGEHVTLVRILIAQGRLDEADQRLQRLLEGARARGHTSREIELLNLRALAAQAGDSLARALSLAEHGGFVQTFVDEGRPMAHLLYEALSREIAPQYVRRLLAAFPIDQPARQEPPQSEAPELEWVEPLSEREFEVLQLVAEGLTNREIASRLFLSLNTVKAHTRNIYGKLDAHSRTQAVARREHWASCPNSRSPDHPVPAKDPSQEP